MTTGDTSEVPDLAATRGGDVTLSALDLLVEIGSDLFPVISRPKPEHYPVNLWPDLNEVLEQHPSIDRLHAAINEHPELQPLYCGSLSARRDTLLAGIVDDVHMALAASSGSGLHSYPRPPARPTKTSTFSPAGYGCRTCAAVELIPSAKAQRWDPAEVVRVLLAEEAAGRDASTLATRHAGPHQATSDHYIE